MRRFAIFVVVVVLLLLVADRVTCRVAEGQIATKIQDAESLSSRPAVTIHGFPFLTQAVRGRYQQVDTSVSDLSVQNGLTIDRVDVHLAGLRLKLADVLNGTVSSVPVDTATMTATVSYPALDAAAKANLPDQGLTVKFGEGQNHLLAVNGKYAGSLLSAQLNAQAKVTVRDGEVLVGLEPSSLADLPAVVRGQVTSLLGGGYKLPRLPFGLKATSVTVGPAGITVRAAANSVNLS